MLTGLQQVIVKWAEDVQERMQQTYTQGGHTDAAGAGSLYQYLTVQPDVTVNDGEGSFSFRLELPDYYIFTDKGRQPTRTMTPSRPTLRESLQGANGWISRKGINVVAATGIQDTKKANKALAFMIARSIHKNGFKGSGWFTQVWGDSEPTMEGWAVQELIKRLQDFLGGNPPPGGATWDINLDLGE